MVHITLTENGFNKSICKQVNCISLSKHLIKAVLKLGSNVNAQAQPINAKTQQ